MSFSVGIEKSRLVVSIPSGALDCPRGSIDRPRDTHPGNVTGPMEAAASSLPKSPPQGKPLLDFRAGEFSSSRIA
jgi:hypothetical protein